MEALARRLNDHGVPICASQVCGCARPLDLKPWQTESWMTSKDPDFSDKAADVCGLYLNPPPNAWCGRWTRSRGCRPRAASTHQPCRARRGSAGGTGPGDSRTARTSGLGPGPRCSPGISPACVPSPWSHLTFTLRAGASTTDPGADNFWPPRQVDLTRP